ncbi:tyrosine-type recombinase/integrase [Pseudoglutamicibacter cumminsii]|uniref:tyrosine-type recombinase/integrase n=1 Tax=Pseudoglutamicibacter cumminsii TaxID=156979 RepID=UPI0021A5D477|nr:tyrosine-type recombinase/integrase [Pseudoglutamicibacter cumminsii]MCT1686158.1 tyrosine-type recombinase/integrase [Pseudoglutamicibacter cumminsii]
MAKKSNRPRGVRQRQNGSWEYRHYWGQVEASALFRKYGEQLPDMPASFWKAGQRAEVYADTLPGIRKARERVLAEIITGTYVPRHIAKELAKREAEAAEREAARLSVTFEQVATEYLAFIREHVDFGTWRTYKSAVRKRLKALHSLPIGSITPNKLEAWYRQLTAETSQRYARKAYDELSRVMKYATGTHEKQHHSSKTYLDKNPCVLRLGPKPKPMKERRALTPEEVHALADGMPPHRSIAIWIGALGGLRQGEILGLQRKHVSFKDGFVWLEVKQQLVRQDGAPAELEDPKTDAGVRRIPLPGMKGVDTFKLFSHWMTNVVGPGEDAFVVPLHPGKPAGIAHTTIGKHMRKAREAASNKLGVDLRKVGTHDLRHTAMTNFGRSRATLADLKLFGGHTNVEAVMIYQHSDAESLARVAGMSREEAQAEAQERQAHLEALREAND